MCLKGHYENAENAHFCRYCTTLCLHTKIFRIRVTAQLIKVRTVGLIASLLSKFDLTIGLG